MRSTYPQVPLVANGDFYQISDVQRILETTGASGVMLARPALLNASMFRQLSNGSGLELMPLETVISLYLRECARWELPYQTAKYTVSTEHR